MVKASAQLGEILVEVYTSQLLGVPFPGFQSRYPQRVGYNIQGESSFLMPLEVLNTFQEEFKLACSPPETTIQHFLYETADLLQGEQGARISLDQVSHKYGPGISVCVTFPASGGGSIGVLFLLATSSNRTILRVPQGRGSGNPDSQNEYDSDRRLFSQFLQAVADEMLKQGLISGWRRFQSGAALEAAERNLALAEDSQFYAAVGNICRSASIELANETYVASMCPPDTEEPKGDDATTKLKYVVMYLGAGHSKRQKVGLIKTVQGVWDFNSAVLHRNNASKPESEMCVRLTSEVFDCMALLTP